MYSQQFIEKIDQAIDDFEVLVYDLVALLVKDTDQPDGDRILQGEYYLIENSGGDLSEGWSYDVHGEHCDFRNRNTGQELTVCLGMNESIKYLDPYFFYDFLRTNSRYESISKEFSNPFNDMYELFRYLESNEIMIKVEEGFGPAFKRIKKATNKT